MKRILKLLVCIISLGVINVAFADYPIVSYRHLADPGALVYDGRVYLYCSNDDNNVASGDDAGYSMNSIVCVSSSDLKNWTDHGIVFQVPEDATWASNSWAPSPVQRNGKFYLYFGNGGSGIGVVSSDSPIGPFTDPIGTKLVSSSTPGVLPADNMWLFDPMTFVDDDGQAYMYFGGNGEDNMRVIKLNEDMISVDGSATSFHVPYFFEASWMHKHNGIYYFSYSTNPSNGLRIDYMTSDDPLSGFTYGGVLSQQPPNNDNNNHHAVFEFNGQWYEAYHNRIVAQQEGIATSYKRNLCLDQFFHNEDGSIETMTNTVDGIEQLEYVNPYECVEAETTNEQEGIETEVCDSDGMKVTDIENSGWIKIRGVDFGDIGVAAFSASVARGIELGTSTNNSIEIYLDDKSGTFIGTVPISYTGGFDVWKTETVAVEEVTGVHDVYFVFKGKNGESLFDFDYWQFTEKSGQELLAINTVVEDSKIDTISGSNKTNISVTAIYTDGTSKDVTSESSFSVDQENIVSITDSIITGANYGTVTITANYENITDDIKVVVKSMESEISVSQIYTDNSDVELFSGTSASIQIFAEYADGHVEDVTEEITCDNPNPEIATIDGGAIIGAIEGEVDITINYQGKLGEEKSTTIHITVTAGSAIWLEPECGQVGENWEIIEDGQVSNDKYVTVKSGFESPDTAPTDTKDQIIIPFSLTSREKFSIYARVKSANNKSASFWVQVNSLTTILHDGISNDGWEWIEIVNYYLRPGEHTLTIGYGENGILLDKIAISNYETEPVGLGGLAQNLDDTAVLNSIQISEEYSLEQNYPNPFNPTTKFTYSLPVNSNVKISVFNICGELVEVLYAGNKDAGRYNITWDASNYSSGIYYYQLNSGRQVLNRKCLLIK